MFDRPQPDIIEDVQEYLLLVARPLFFSLDGKNRKVHQILVSDRRDGISILWDFQVRTQFEISRTDSLNQFKKKKLHQCRLAVKYLTQLVDYYLRLVHEYVN